MAYMLFVAEPRGQRAERTDEEGKALYQRMLDYADDLKSRGVLRAYSSLRNDSEGQRLQIRDGKRSLRDGPFAEAREMIGGFSWSTAPRARKPSNSPHCVPPPSGRPWKCAKPGRAI